jgi:hypothetical protein
LKGTSSERVDDVPVVIKWLSEMQIEALINQEIPSPHGNRKGLSYGQLAVLLLTGLKQKSRSNKGIIQA